MTSNMNPLELRKAMSLFFICGLFCGGRVVGHLDRREELRVLLRIDPVANAGRDGELAVLREVPFEPEAQIDQHVPVRGEPE